MFASRPDANRRRPQARRDVRGRRLADDRAPTAEPPIAGSDDLTADELVARLPEQSQVTLGAVAAYEKAKGNRTTVLERVAALTGTEPAPGYDDLTADEVQKLVTRRRRRPRGRRARLQRRHKARASVLEAAARNADAS